MFQKLYKKKYGSSFVEAWNLAVFFSRVYAWGRLRNVHVPLKLFVATNPREKHGLPPHK